MVKAGAEIQGGTSLPGDVLAAVERGREDDAAEAGQGEGFEAEKPDRRRNQIRSGSFVHVVLVGVGLSGVALGVAGEGVASFISKPPVVAVPEGDLATGG